MLMPRTKADRPEDLEENQFDYAILEDFAFARYMLKKDPWVGEVNFIPINSPRGIGNPGEDLLVPNPSILYGEGPDSGRYESPR